VIPKTAHRTEREIWGEFAAQQPAILGALLDAVSAAVRKLPETRLELPRMAEFAEWVTAAEEALGWAPGSFMSAYEEGREEAMAGALESDPVAGAVLSFMEGREEWVGKSAELLEELASEVDEKVERSKSWPKTASHLSNRLKRLAPALRAEGLDYEDWREAGGGRQRQKRLSWRHEAHKGGWDGGGTAPKDPGTPPGDPVRDTRPGHAPRRDGHHRHEGQPGTTRDGAPRPYSADSTPADHVSVDTAQIQSASSHEGSPRAEVPRMTLAPAEDGQSGDAEERPGPSLPSRTAGESPVRRKHLRLLATPDDVSMLVEEIEAAGAVALDLETTGLDPRRDEIRLLSLATPDGMWLIDCSALDPGPILAALAGKKLIAHNSMFDLLFLRCLGYKHRGRVTDTMILSRMVHAGERDASGKRLDHSLEACCERELGLDLDKTHQNADWAGELTQGMLRYAAEDARVLLLLYDVLARRIRKQGQERAVEIEERVLPAVIEMAHAGVPVDKDRWLRMIDEAKAELEDLRGPLDALAGAPPDEVRKKNANNKNIPAERKDKWNWDSPEQVMAAAKSVGLKLKKTSTDYLKGVNHDLTRALVAYKEARGNLGTYGETFFRADQGGPGGLRGGQNLPLVEGVRGRHRQDELRRA
jgi:DNA polymerase III epsilon subunit-like protein